MILYNLKLLIDFVDNQHEINNYLLCLLYLLTFHRVPKYVVCKQPHEKQMKASHLSHDIIKQSKVN